MALEAEKRNKKGKHGNLSTGKVKKLSCITAAYSYERAAMQRVELRRLENCGRMMILRIITISAHNNFWRFQ